MTNNEEQEESTQVMIPAESRISFLQKNDLDKVKRKISKSIDKAILLLENVLMDETVEMKQRVDAAKYLITVNKDINESISRDQLQRLIAESRMVLAMQATQQRVSKFAGSGNAEEETEDNPVPRYCPDILLNDNISQM